MKSFEFEKDVERTLEVFFLKFGFARRSRGHDGDGDSTLGIEHDIQPICLYRLECSAEKFSTRLCRQISKNAAHPASSLLYTIGRLVGPASFPDAYSLSN